MPRSVVLESRLRDMEKLTVGKADGIKFAIQLMGRETDSPNVFNFPCFAKELPNGVGQGCIIGDQRVPQFRAHRLIGSMLQEPRPRGVYTYKVTIALYGYLSCSNYYAIP